MNRRQMMFGGLVPALGAMGLLAPAALAKTKVKKKKGKKKFKTVTRTFHNPAPINLFNFGPAALYPSPITVKGLKEGKILDVNLTLHGFSHEQAADLDMLLQAPDGSCIQFLSDAGGSANFNNITVTFDDQAATSVEQFAPPESTSYKPTLFGDVDLLPPPAPQFITGGTFAVFKQRNPNGVWRLYINDDSANVESGEISGGWSLRIKARVKK